MGKKRGPKEMSDQYGEIGGSQDREIHHGNFGKGRGGGDAGGGGRTATNLTFERHVPKFLRGFEHMLGKGAGHQDEDAPVMQKFADPESDDDDAGDDDQQEALKRAIEEDPTLLEIHPELKDVATKAQAASLKDKGNKAFAAQKYEEALDCFSQCITLDPTNEVYYSNRAAALTNLKRYDEAADDARQVIRLKPSWVKGHVRLGAALFGAEEYGEAREAYEAAIKIEPNDRTLMSSLEKARMFEARQEAEHKHRFKKARDDKQLPSRQQTVKQTVKNKTLLSFADEEEADGE